MTQTITVKMDKDSEYYFVDASATDQGAVDASYDSAKDLIDAIGVTKNATLVFSHSGGGNTTTYTFSTSETIPRNINVIVENGARIAVATGITLTINGAINVPLLQWISLAGTGKVDFSGASIDCVYPEWWGAARDATTNDVAAFDAASAAISAGTIRLLHDTYMLSTVFELTGTGKHLVGSGRQASIIITPIDNNGAAINIGSTGTAAVNCSIRDLTVTRATGTPAANDKGVNVSNAVNCWVENVRVTRQQHGIDVDAHDGAITTVVGTRIINCGFDDVTSAYVRIGDADRTDITNNTFGLASETLDMQHCIRIEDLADNVLIVDNTFIPSDNAAPDSGVYIESTYAGSGTYITITGNQFSSTTPNSFAMSAAEAVHLTITGNRFDSGITIKGSTTCLVLVGNKMASTPVLSGTFSEIINEGNSLTDEIFTASGAISLGAPVVLLNQASSSLAITIAAPTPRRKLTIMQTDAGTQGHTVTLTAGTWDGTNTIATFNAQYETLIVWGATATRFLIVENIGSVGLST